MGEIKFSDSREIYSRRMYLCINLKELDLYMTKIDVESQGQYMKVLNLSSRLNIPKTIVHRIMPYISKK